MMRPSENEMVAQELLFPTELGLGLGFGLNPSLFEAQQPPDRAGDIHPSFSFFSFLFWAFAIFLRYYCNFLFSTRFEMIVFLLDIMTSRE